MNTEIKTTITQAEGRFLTDGEAETLRRFAVGMDGRLDAARRLEAAEDDIVEGALYRFFERHPDDSHAEADTRARFVRDLRLTLRYVAAAQVRDDGEWFRRQFAEWNAQTLKNIADATLLVAMFRTLAEEVEERLDPTDARAFHPYLDQFVQALAS